MAYDSVDYSGLINDAQQQRDQAKMRFMALAQARANYNKSMNDQYQAQMKAAQDADLAGKENILGSAGTGALSGLQSGGPWGALIGAGIGLGVGGLQSYNAQKAAGKSGNEIAWGKDKSLSSKLKDIGLFGLTGGFSSLTSNGNSGGLVQNMMTGGVSGAAQQAREGRLNQASFIPGTKYTATAGMLGSLGGGMAGKAMSSNKALNFSPEEMQQAQNAPGLGGPSYSSDNPLLSNYNPIAGKNMNVQLGPPKVLDFSNPNGGYQYGQQLNMDPSLDPNNPYRWSGFYQGY